MMYALNRELEYYDMPEVRQIVHNAAGKNYTFASIVTGIVTSDAFLRQGPEVRSTKVTTAANASPGATKQVQEK